jgi:hypothetical protein
MCVWGLELLVYAGLRHYCMRPYATIVCGLELLAQMREWRYVASSV